MLHISLFPLFSLLYYLSFIIFFFDKQPNRVSNRTVRIHQFILRHVRVHLFVLPHYQINIYSLMYKEQGVSGPCSEVEVVSKLQITCRYTSTAQRECHSRGPPRPRTRGRPYRFPVTGVGRSGFTSCSLQPTVMCGTLGERPTPTAAEGG